VSPQTEKPDRPVPILFDTDMTGDCDDCGALAVLHALADAGEAEILGCIASFGANPYVAGCIAAINAWYGRPEVPIGAEQTPYGRPDSAYLEGVAVDTDRYGHRIVTNRDVPDHVSTYRRLLAGRTRPDVTIVTVGRLKGLHDLLASGPDAVSLLDGVSLVRASVRLWVCMGGQYPTSGGRPEANFHSFGGAAYAAKTVRLWPGAALFSGFEIGREILTGPELEAFGDENPVRRAYRLFFDAHTRLGAPRSRPSWDQTAVLAAVRGPAPYWDVRRGTNRVSEDGDTEWLDQPDQGHAHLVRRMPSEAVAGVISELMARAPRARG
jgi:hypothetical protein